jgi:Uncharacterised methyltransferase family (DUF6094)/Helicase conserved C-terminal domain
MTRLASIAKAGFYPTPPRVYEWIARFVCPGQDGARLIDPCCGEGIAAAYLAQAWHLVSYGIEIDAERARASVQRLSRVLQLDYGAARISPHAFQVLFLNPPYSPEEGESRRTEYRFLRDTTKWLQPGGLLIYIIPQYRLDPRMARFLATYYTDLCAYRFPDPEYADFRQMVVFGVLKPEPLFNEQVGLALLQDCHGQLLVLPEKPDSTFTLPVPDADRFYFRGNVIDPDEAFAEALKAGVWQTSEWREWLEPPNELDILQPLMPLKKGHLAMLIAAGLLQNLRLERGAERLLIKGRTYKVSEEVESGEENEEVVRDRFVTEIVAVDLKTGSVTRLGEPQALSEFIETWQDVIAAQVLATFTPLYRFDYEAMGDGTVQVLNRLSKHRRLPGRKETGLFAAQKHVAVALWKRLQRANFAILVGEMGVGKTTIASAVSALMGAKGNPTLILCPPHLVNKWVREVREIVPLSFAMPLYRLSDVERFVLEFKRLAPGTPAFAVLSREMAKLGSGWLPAYARRKRLMHVGGDRRQVLNLFACPRCGHIVHHVEGNQETAPVMSLDYFAKKQRCFECKEPLYQMTHLNGQSASSFAKFQEQLSQPSSLANLLPPQQQGSTRFPIADYIARRHRGFFKLLFSDEVHQLKGQSTDQGYAFGSLIRACDKTLALTGTLFGGRATSLFFLMHRLSPQVRGRFGWSDAQKWAERFGILERVTKTSEDNDEYGVYSGKRRRKTFVRELPGISPELVMQLLDSAAFLALADLGFELPEYREEPVILSMTPEQRIACDDLQTTLEAELHARLVQGDKSLLGAYLQSLLAYPNSCFREEVVRAPDGEVVASAPALGEDRLFPKEEWLVNLATRERAQGRRLLVFCRQTGTRDITARIKGLLQQAGLRTVVLNASVGTQVREEWLRHRVSQGVDVLITNPKLVETGIDLIAFQSTVFYEVEYSLYTMQQAARRTWRLGQVDDVVTYYAIYADTMEHRAMGLIAQKLAAALLLTGDEVQGALVEETDSGHGFLADLSKSVISGAQIADLNSLFRDRSPEHTTKSEFLGVPKINWDAVPEEEVEESLFVIKPIAYQQLPLL